MKFASAFIILFILLILLSCRKDLTGFEGHVFSGEWETASASEQGFDAGKLQQAFDAAEGIGFMDCLLIVKNGYIVGEQYYNGYDELTVHNVKSVSKSFLSAVTGIALREGYLGNLDQKMLNFFPEYDSPDLDARKQDITLRHLLNMRMGLEHERYNYSQLYYSANWIEATIDFPLMYNPGSTFSYNTFQTHLLSAILTKASGMSTLALADSFLFEPLNIATTYWQQGPSGYYFGGNSMYFTPRHIAVLGYLYLHDGFINGQQVIPADWVRESLSNSTGFINNDWGNWEDMNYGYLWWLGKIGGYRTFQAMGYGGQLVVCFPQLNMIVVTTSRTNVDWDTSDQHIAGIIDIIADFIVPALK